MCCVLGSARRQFGTERNGEGQERDRLRSLVEIEARGERKGIKELFQILYFHAYSDTIAFILLAEPYMLCIELLGSHPQAHPVSFRLYLAYRLSFFLDVILIYIQSHV